MCLTPMNRTTVPTIEPVIINRLSSGSCDGVTTTVDSNAYAWPRAIDTATVNSAAKSKDFINIVTQNLLIKLLSNDNQLIII